MPVILASQVAAIQRMGLRTVMLTGDCAGAAAAVATAAALRPSDVHSGLLPADKLAEVGAARPHQNRSAHQHRHMRQWPT